MKLIEINIDDSFCAKKQVQSLKIIFQVICKQRNRLQDYESYETPIDLISKIRLIANEIYSGCEIINQMLISIYRNDNRYRGTNLKKGFNDNFKEIYNACVNGNKSLNGVYNDEFIMSYFCSAKSWFITIHDIRTQETHYEVGRIETCEDILFYINGNRNGTSKQLYTNPSEETRISVEQFINTVDEFLKTEDTIVRFINSVNSS